MLTAIRDRASGLIAWIVVILLIIPFAFWGIESYFGGGGPANVAVVNGSGISKDALNNQVQRELRGVKTPPEGAAAAKFRREVLQRMIRNEVLIKGAEKAGFRISDAYLGARIRSMSVFQQDGKFDQKLYTRLLYSNNYSEKTFEAAQRQDLLLEQLVSGVVQSEFVTPQEMDSFIRLRDRKLKLSYVIVPSTQFLKSVKVSDADIAKYYDQHHNDFMRPERVKLRYVEVDQNQIAAGIQAPEDKLRQMYQSQKASFHTPERRRAAHILIAVDKNADAKAVAAAKKKAMDIYARIKAGASFAEQAKKYSTDSGSAAEGGDLGWIDKGTLDPAFEKALYGLPKKGDVSEPVRSQYGFHIIKLEDIKPPEQKSFAQVRDLLAQQYRSQQAENIYYDRSQKLQDASEENPLNLQPAAQAVGAKIMQSDWINRGEKADKGIAKYPQIVRAAFSDETLGGGNLKDAVNSRMIEIGKGEGGATGNVAIVLHVAAYEPAKLRPLAEVHDEIAKRLRADDAQAKARELGQNMLNQAKAGKKLPELAAQHQLKVIDTGFIGRNDQSHTPDVVAQAFRMPKPASGRVSLGGVELPEGGYAVIDITAAKDGDPKDTPKQMRSVFERSLSNLFGGADMEGLVKELRAEAEVKVLDKNLNSDNSGG